MSLIELSPEMKPALVERWAVLEMKNCRLSQIQVQGGEMESR